MIIYKASLSSSLVCRFTF